MELCYILSKSFSYISRVYFTSSFSKKLLYPRKWNFLALKLKRFLHFQKKAFLIFWEMELLKF